MIKNVIQLLIIGSSLLTLGSCNKKTEQDRNAKTTPDSLSGTPIEASGSVEQTELLQTIVGSPSGLVRGFGMGDALEKIKATETFDIFEDSTGHIGYTYESKNFETVDVLYFLDANKNLNGIKIDVYLNNESSTRALFDQLETYLSGRFKKDNSNAKQGLWYTPDSGPIKLEDVTNGKDFGIRLSFGNKASA